MSLPHTSPRRLQYGGGGPFTLWNTIHHNRDKFDLGCGLFAVDDLYCFHAKPTRRRRVDVLIVGTSYSSSTSLPVGTDTQYIYSILLVVFNDVMWPQIQSDQERLNNLKLPADTRNTSVWSHAAACVLLFSMWTGCAEQRRSMWTFIKAELKWKPLNWIHDSSINNCRRIGNVQNITSLLWYAVTPLSVAVSIYS